MTDDVIFERTDDNGEVIETIKLPWRFVVCGTCEGHGKVTPRNLECRGGGFTQSEYDEINGDDPDFFPGYFSGRFDVTCEDCKGNRVVKARDDDRIAPDLLAEIEHNERLDAIAARECAAEAAAESRFMYGPS